MPSEIARVEPGHVVTVESPLSQTLALVKNLARDPAVTADKIDALLRAAAVFSAEEARLEFNEALARIQPRLPVIEKNGAISFEDKKGIVHNTPFATYEDIQAAILPVLSPEGFSLSFSSEPVQGGIQYAGTLKHRRGHSETSKMVLPADTSGSKNALQAVGSTMAYASRYLTRNLLNLQIRRGAPGTDTDGSSAHYVSDAQLNKIEEFIELCKMTPAERDAFCVYMDVKMTGDIKERDFDKAVTQLRDFFRRKKAAPHA